MDQLYNKPAKLSEFEKINKEASETRNLLSKIINEQQKQRLIDRVIRIRGKKWGLGFIIGDTKNGRLLILTDASNLLTNDVEYENLAEMISRPKLSGFIKFGPQVSGFSVNILQIDKETGLALLISKNSFPREYDSFKFQQISLLKNNNSLYLLQSGWDTSIGLEFLNANEVINSTKLVKIDSQKKLLIVEEGNGKKPEPGKSFSGAPIFSRIEGVVQLVGIRIDNPVPSKGLLEKFDKSAKKKFYVIPAPIIKQFLNEAMQKLKDEK